MGMGIDPPDAVAIIRGGFIAACDHEQQPTPPRAPPHIPGQP